MPRIMQNTASPRTRRRTWARALFAAIAAGAVGLVHGSCTGPLSVPPLAGTSEPLRTDEQFELARRYGPWILNEIHPTKGRQDLPTRADFDGNLRGDDDWEHLPLFELPPVVYYAVVGSETHWFLTYHLFHPRDWSCFDLGLHMTHENDGENLQVVVEKASGRVVLLFTQAHYRGGVYALPDSGFAAAAEEIRGPFVLVDERGRTDPLGRHAVVFVERCGHAIDGLATRAGDVALADDGSVTIRGRGLVMRPALDGDPIAEPALDQSTPVPYALASTVASFWKGLTDGSLRGEGGLFDGSLRLQTRELTIDVPRYYEANRFSGPFGPDRGISPFAVDFRFGEGEVGALLFDPARRYAATLVVPTPWSTRYTEFPFTIGR